MMKTRLPDRQQYWHRTRRLTLVLLLLWTLVTFVVSWFARELNEVLFLGFPLGFYMAAQGTLFVYLAIVWYYCRAMNRLDAQYGIDGEQK